MQITLCVLIDEEIATRKICGDDIAHHLVRSLEELNAHKVLVIKSSDFADISSQALKISIPDNNFAFLKKIKQLSDSNIIILLPANLLYVDLKIIKRLADLAQEHLLSIVTFQCASNKYNEVVIENNQAMIKPLSNDNHPCTRYSGITAINIAKLNCVKDHDSMNPVAYINMNKNDFIFIEGSHQLVEAERNMQRQLKEKATEGGVVFIDPKSVYLSFDTKIASGVTVYPHVFIGLGVTVEKDVSILSFSHIEHAHIGCNCQIGPFARIRDATNIQQDCQIGNFVEIKNSTMKKSVKVKHLSYIGDSEIGENTNIGAGVITCNYDGYKKYRTVIDKNCFIGANTSLIAPLYVAENVTIGAGSTITHDIDTKKSLVIARARQITKSK